MHWGKTLGGASRVEIAQELLGRDRLADMNAVVEGNALGLHLADAPLDVELLHLEVGDAVAQEPAGAPVLLEDVHLVADARELLRGGKSRRPRADDRDALAGEGIGRLRDDPALLPAAVGNGALDRLDGDRRLLEVERAGCLAGRR